jgi:tetratricopeptide (TPR) repeat protein
MIRPGRATPVFLAALAALACQPTASVRHAVPLANLKPYRTVLIRVNASVPADREKVALETAASERLSRLCRFQGVTLASRGADKADLFLDLNIVRVNRVSERPLIDRVRSRSEIAIAMVLTDGATDELVGSAEIQGQAASELTSGDTWQAISIAADEIAHLMTTSGCAIPRSAPVTAEKTATEDRAKNTDEPPPAAGGGEAGDDTAAEASNEPPRGDHTGANPRAEALNEEGKDRFRRGDLEGALQRFRAAIELSPDPRFYFNLCLALEHQKNYARALTACQRVIDLETEPRLVEKAQWHIHAIRAARSQQAKAR